MLRAEDWWSDCCRLWRDAAWRLCSTAAECSCAFLRSSATLELLGSLAREESGVWLAREAREGVWDAREAREGVCPAREAREGVWLVREERGLASEVEAREERGLKVGGLIGQQEHSPGNPVIENTLTLARLPPTPQHYVAQCTQRQVFSVA